MEGNLLVVHGGGPTAVLNASLYGVIRQAKECPEIGKIYGAIGGSEAVLTENFLDMGELPDERLNCCFKRRVRLSVLPDFRLSRNNMRQWFPF